MSTAPMSPPSFPMALTMRANVPIRFGYASRMVKL